MLDPNDQTPAPERASSPPSVAHPANDARLAANGTPSQPAAAAVPPPPAAPDPAVAKVDLVANRVGFAAAYGTRKLVSVLSRTREAFQDFWAEVQDYRHGRKP
jgi:hypothetical protein